MADATILFLHALTGLHPGSGTALGVVDLPVQRERHTQWPLVPGSSLKGILRSTCAQARIDTDLVYAAFGPDTAGAHEHAGAIAVTDARIAAFPVRSLRGVFAWATCPAVLERMRRDALLAGVAAASLPAVPEVKPNHGLCTQGSPLRVDNARRVILEEFEFEAQDGAADAAAWLAANAVADAPTAARLRTHCVILNDDDFTHFVRHATEVVARIGLDYEKKTVKGGALFYEEFLPAESLFYALVFALDSRRESIRRSGKEMLAWLKQATPEVLQIGAAETIGKGLCAVRFASGTEART